MLMMTLLTKPWFIIHRYHYEPLHLGAYVQYMLLLYNSFRHMKRGLRLLLKQPPLYAPFFQSIEKPLFLLFIFILSCRSSLLWNPYYFLKSDISVAVVCLLSTRHVWHQRPSQGFCVCVQSTNCYCGSVSGPSLVHVSRWLLQWQGWTVYPAL